MTKKIITEDEAREILALNRAMPWRELNGVGRMAVADWVVSMAREPGSVNLNAWYQQADQDAANAGIDSAVIVEMRGYMSITGRPETLRLKAVHFDWCVSDERVTA